MATYPGPSLEYAEQILARSLEEQSDVATFLGNGALTAVSVLLAAYSLLFSIALQRADLPPIYLLILSGSMIGVATAMLGRGWYLCNIGEATDPVQTTKDLLPNGVPVNDVREKVVLTMLVSYDKTKIDLARVQRWLVIALPLSLIGLSLFIYGLIP